VNGVEFALGAGAAVLLLAVLAVRLSTRLGLPSLLVYLAIGLLIGEAGLGIQFSDAPLTAELGIAGLVLILAEGGLTTRWSVIRPVLSWGIALSTVAVAVNIAVTGWALHLLLSLDWRMALLWGAVLSSTDAAAVFSVLRALKVSPQLAGALEMESGINDAPVYIAVVLLAAGDSLRWWTPLLVGYELLVGALVGAALGFAGAWTLRRAALPATGLYPLASIAVCVLAFAAGQGLHASGFLATYLAGLVLGNARLPHRGDTVSFAEGLGWLAQIGLPLVVRWLGLSRPEQGREMEVDAAALDDMHAELLQIRVPRPSRLHGVYLSELRLPSGAVVSLVVRDGKGFTPQLTTRLEEGDQLLVITTAGNRDRAEQRIRAVHRAGRLARWRGESGA
jgi:cell volume regulation protein A